MIPIIYSIGFNIGAVELPFNSLNMDEMSYPTPAEINGTSVTLHVCCRDDGDTGDLEFPTPQPFAFLKVCCTLVIPTTLSMVFFF